MENIKKYLIEKSGEDNQEDIKTFIEKSAEENQENILTYFELEITRDIYQICYNIIKKYGYGLRENAYNRILYNECLNKFQKYNLEVKFQEKKNIYWQNKKITEFIIDLRIENCIFEIKSLNNLGINRAISQVRSYSKNFKTSHYNFMSKFILNFSNNYFMMYKVLDYYYCQMNGQHIDILEYIPLEDNLLKFYYEEKRKIEEEPKIC